MIQRTSIFALVAALLSVVACAAETEQAADNSMAATELVERIDAGSAPLVLDVRSRDEYAKGHIPGAVNIPHDELASRLDELSVATTDEVVVHCQSGKRAGMAQATLRESGYSNVRDLTGHWKGWQSSGLATEQ